MNTNRNQITLDEIGRILAHNLRRWMLLAIAEMHPCQQELATLLGFDKSAISQNLARLERCNLVRHFRQGKMHITSLTNNAVATRVDRRVTIVCRASNGDETSMRFTLPEPVARRFDDFTGGHIRREAV